MAEYDGPGAYENAHPERGLDAREEMRDAIRRGLYTNNVVDDPDQVEDLVDGVMDALVEQVRPDQTGWFILGNLGHVYYVESAKMTYAAARDHSRWEIHIRND